MRVLRAVFIALITAFVGCVLAFFVGDYLTRLAHVPEMEGQRGMTVVFLCVPLGILAGLVIGILSAIVVRRQGFAGFLVAQGWSLLIVCGLASLLAGNETVASQFVGLIIPPTPRKEDETWSDWIFAAQRADLSSVSDPERMALRYRVRPIDD